MTERLPGRPDTEDADALLDRLEAAVASGRLAVSRTDGLALHAVALQAARGHGPFEVAIGEGLDLILRRGGLARLGSSGLGDLAREKLGLQEGPARRLRRNAEKLRERPLLRAAVLAGEVTSRKAEILLDRTEPRDDAYWTARARNEPVLRLEAALRGPAGAQEEDWHRIEVELPPEGAVVVETALRYARVLVGPNAHRLRLVEVMLWEFLGEFETREGTHASTDAAAGRLPRPADVEREAAGAVATAAPPWAVPAAAGSEPFDPTVALARLQALVRERASLDERLRRACLLVRETRAWGWTDHRNFTVWCAEGLGISPRTIRSHVQLERKLRALPPLREAVRSHTLSLEQARQVARHATPENVAARIERVLSKPVIAARREADEVPRPRPASRAYARDGSAGLDPPIRRASRRPSGTRCGPAGTISRA